MKEIITNDGSVTFYSEEYDEACHSKSGAVEESLKKFAEPCINKGTKKVLDICFGIGYNSAAALQEFFGRGGDGKIEITAIEKDREIMKRIKGLNPGLKYYGVIKKAAENGYSYEDGRIRLNILVGNAEEKIKGLKEEFDAVFLDPFSPPKNPELWTADFLSDVFARMKKGGVLATYSCARIVRENLRKAGFSVMDGPVVGRRAPSTIARKDL